MPGESRYVNVDGINTHYRVAGEGPPLLLLHGLGASFVTWRDNIGPLSRAFRVYAVDLPGHGDSDKPDMDYSPETVVRYTVRLVQALKLDRPAIIGNSVGGTLGLLVALQHPGLVSRLIVVGSPGFGKEVSLYVRLAALPVLGDVLESSRVGGTRYMLYNVFYDRSFVTPGLLNELYRSRQMPGAKEAVVRTLRHSVTPMGVRRRYILLDQLARLDIPLLVVWGSHDRILPVAHAYRVPAVAPQARLAVFDCCGHWPHMEKAEDFNALALQFLSGCNL